MAMATISPLSSHLVGSILRSVRQRDTGALESALDRAGEVRPDVISADQEERLELIHAIATEMRTTVRRAQGVVRFEGFDAYVPLLKNLASRQRVSQRPDAQV